jgi:serine/threonine-protein kinase ATR
VLDQIPQKVRATAAFRCKAFARALMHYDMYFRSNGGLTRSVQDPQIQRDFGQIQKVYSYLDEGDGMEGITIMFTKPTLDQKILEHESSGLWTAAQTCNELALHRSPHVFKFHIGLLKCLMH